MTLATYSRATDLRVKIQHYEDIIAVFKNAKGNNLSAIKIKDLSVMNTVHIMDEPILQKFIDLVGEEIELLEDEFRKL